MSNNKQLGLAWIMYSGDNNEYLAMNMDVRNNTQTPPILFNGGPAWITGVIDWGIGSYNTNTDEIINPKYSLLGQYLAKSARVFACPAANYLSPAQAGMHWNNRVRSVAMNAAVGDGPKYPISNFTWNQSTWYVANKSTDFHSPGPSDVWVFTDEHPDSIDDALMYTSNYGVTEFIELPGNQHVAVLAAWLLATVTRKFTIGMDRSWPLIEMSPIPSFKDRPVRLQICGYALSWLLIHHGTEPDAKMCYACPPPLCRVRECQPKTVNLFFEA